MLKLFSFFAVILIVTNSIFPQVKTIAPPKSKIPYSKSLQAVLVTTKDWNAVQGTAQHPTPQATVMVVADVIAAALSPLAPR